MPGTDRLARHKRSQQRGILAAMMLFNQNGRLCFCLTFSVSYYVVSSAQPGGQPRFKNCFIQI